MLWNLFDVTEPLLYHSHKKQKDTILFFVSKWKHTSNLSWPSIQKPIQETHNTLRWGRDPILKLHKLNICSFFKIPSGQEQKKNYRSLLIGLVCYTHTHLYITWYLFDVTETHLYSENTSRPWNDAACQILIQETLHNLGLRWDRDPGLASSYVKNKTEAYFPLPHNVLL